MFEPDSLKSLPSFGSPDVSVEEVLLDVESRRLHGSLEDVGDKSVAFKLAAVAVLFIMGVTVFRLYSLQIQKGNSYLLAAEGNRIRTIPQFAPRGLIYDRYGQIIVRNTPNFELVALPIDLPQADQARSNLFTRIGEVVGLSQAEITDILSKAPAGLIEPVVIKQSLTQDQALQLEHLIFDFPGFQVQSAPTREYLQGPAFAHIVGYVGKINEQEWAEKRNSGYFFNDTIGKTGVELVYESSLRGDHGQIEIEVDATGKPKQQLREIASHHGEDLTLTIDADMQKLLFDLLDNTLRTRPSATGASGIVLDTRTGEILALVSLPSYDNNLFARGISTADYQGLVNNPKKPMLNRAIAGVYPPGSVVKPVVGAGALSEGLITDKTKINDQGFIQAGGRTFFGWNREGFGPIDIYTAISQSSDPFFYVVGGGHPDYKIDGLGVDRLVDYFRKFNLGTLTGVPLPGEEPGFVPTPAWKSQRFAGTDEERWYLGNTYHLAIGQGFLLATPIQVAVFTAGIANDGVLMQPYLKADERPKILRESGIDIKHLEIIQRAMRENVMSGSGVRLNDLPVTSAGKTGTSQFDARDPTRTHAWFTAYAPFEQPEIAVTVLVEAGGEGHAAAVPVVREVIKWWSEFR